MIDNIGNNSKIIVGLVDADLLAKGTRHPNLALLKIAGFLNDNNVEFELILDSKADVSKYTHVYLSRVFTFTPLPDFYVNTIGSPDENKFHVGGTGFYVTETNVKEFSRKRSEDMRKLEDDPFWLTCKVPCLSYPKIL